MKKILFVLLVCFLFASCGQFRAIQDQSNLSDIAGLNPQGLIYGKEIGRNWWKGTFEGKQVLIHVVHTYSYDNVDITFIGNK